MARTFTGKPRLEPFTFALSRNLREQLAEYAGQQGITVGECIRRILAEKFTQLQRGEESP